MVGWLNDLMYSVDCWMIAVCENMMIPIKLIKKTESTIYICSTHEVVYGKSCINRGFE
jgi:hypothetical protein